MNDQPVDLGAVARRRRSAPPPVYFKSGRFWNLSDNILHLLADSDRFHSVAEIQALLNAQMLDGSPLLEEKHIKPACRAIKGRKDAHVEERKAAKGQRHYKFFRQEQSIGLSVLKAKFKPVVEDLKAQAAMPISHQSTGRFLAAAGALTQILRDLEAWTPPRRVGAGRGGSIRRRKEVKHEHQARQLEDGAGDGEAGPALRHDGTVDR